MMHVAWCEREARSRKRAGERRWPPPLRPLFKKTAWSLWSCTQEAGKISWPSSGEMRLLIFDIKYGQVAVFIYFGSYCARNFCCSLAAFVQQWCELIFFLSILLGILPGVGVSCYQPGVRNPLGYTALSRKQGVMKTQKGLFCTIPGSVIDRLITESGNEL